MKNDEFEQSGIDEILLVLGRLQTSAPGNTIYRLRKRIRTFQLGRDLVKQQVYGFWIVLDALLKVVFRLSTRAQDRREKKIR